MRFKVLVGSMRFWKSGDYCENCEDFFEHVCASRILLVAYVPWSRKAALYDVNVLIVHVHAY